MSDRVRRMFADIAPDYDRANTVLSLGIHDRWRRRAVELAEAGKGFDVLDCATGTGDLAFDFSHEVGPSGHVVGIDFVQDMVERARVKAGEQSADTRFAVADALRLPFGDDAFDLSSIGFGIRNVDDPVQCLREMARVVKHEGRVVVLEFGQPDGMMSWPYQFYSRHVIPRVGALLTGNREAYEYLPRTQAQFPCGEDFLALMDEADVFTQTSYEALTGGIAYIYVGEVG